MECNREAGKEKDHKFEVQMALKQNLWSSPEAKHGQAWHKFAL